jgi:hypothetical protein
VLRSVKHEIALESAHAPHPHAPKFRAPNLANGANQRIPGKFNECVGGSLPKPFRDFDPGVLDEVYKDGIDLAACLGPEIDATHYAR